MPRYVGRSDYDVQERLAHHEQGSVLSYFRVRLCKTPAEAFSLECQYWHALLDQDRLINRLHPDAPSRSDLLCPYCSAANEFDRLANKRPSRKRNVFSRSGKKTG